MEPMVILENNDIDFTSSLENNMNSDSNEIVQSSNTISNNVSSEQLYDTDSIEHNKSVSI